MELSTRGTRLGRVMSGPGRTPPTSKDVAALAGVSQSTVSYVMTGKRAVSVETRHRVEQAMEQLGYHPNAGARALRGAKTNVIALMVHLGADIDLNDTIPYVEAIIDEARQRDYDVVLTASDDGPEGLRRLAGRRVVDAFVIMDIRTRDQRLETAAELGLPVILFGRPANSHGLDAVDFDARQAANLLVEELAATGHRHAVIVADALEAEAHDLCFIQEFHDGARQAGRLHGLPVDIVFPARDGWAAIEEASEQIFRHLPDRLGLIARSPKMTQWLVQLARIKGLEIGKDLSLVSMCSDQDALEFDPPITNVVPMPRDLCRLGMRLLFERIEGDTGPARLVLAQPGRLTRRASLIEF